VYDFVGKILEGKGVGAGRRTWFGGCVVVEGTVQSFVWRECYCGGKAGAVNVRFQDFMRKEWHHEGKARPGNVL